MNPRKLGISLFFASAIFLALAEWYPWRASNMLLWVIHLRQPAVYSQFYWVWTLTNFMSPFFLALVFQANSKSLAKQVEKALKLPVYVEPEDRDELYLVLGEGEREVEKGGITQKMLEWVKVPALGIFNGILIAGATGRGKTSAGMLVIARQLIFWRKNSQADKLSGLALEPKGNFCHQVRELLVEAGREKDYYEIGPQSLTTFNLLASPLSPHEMAFSLGALIEQSRGRKSHDPFWRDAYSNAIENVLNLYRICDGWVTLRDVYRGLVSDRFLSEKLIEAQNKMEGEVYFTFTREDYLKKDKTLKKYGAVSAADWKDPELQAQYGHYVAPWSNGLEEYLRSDSAPPFKILQEGVNFRMGSAARFSAEDRERWEAVKFAIQEGWFHLEVKLRAAIVETCRGALSIFDDPEIRKTFCPAKDDPNQLPPFQELIETGKWVGVNFPPASNASLSRFVNVMVKLTFEREVLQRIERGNVGRPVAMLADEADQIASVGLNEPIGDDKTAARGREAKLIMVWALHSFSSLAAQVGEHWRSLAQHFSTKVLMGLTDDFTAEICEKLCAREEQWREGYNLGESGQKATIDPLTNAVSTSQQGISAGTSYSLQYVPRVPTREFYSLPNGAAWALIYNGREPEDPRKIWMKPHFLDYQPKNLRHSMSWQEQRKEGLI